METHNQFKTLPFNNIKYYGRKEARLGSGAYGAVFQTVTDVGNKYAIKKPGFGSQTETKGEIAATTIREISSLVLLNHPNIINLIDVVFHPKSGNLNMVMEIGLSDLTNYLKNNTIDTPDIKQYFYQLIKATEYMHSLSIWHRDIKPQNIIIFPNKVIKLGDFGLTRFASIPGLQYTWPVATMWWRAPDVLLGNNRYGPDVDIWSLGVVLYEIASGSYLVKGETEEETLNQLVVKVGGMTEAQWPGLSGMREYDSIRKIAEDHPTGSIFSDQKLIDRLGDDGMDLLKKLLTPNPSKRITAVEAANHPYFNDIRMNYNNFPPVDNNTTCGVNRIKLDIGPSNVMYSNDINNGMMEILMHWLNEVKVEYHMTNDTLYRARSIIDQYIKITDSSTPRSRLQLLGIVAVNIAAKIEEIYPPGIDDFIYISDNTFTSAQMVEMEKEVLIKLGFKLAYPTISEYIRYYNELLFNSIINDANILGSAIIISSNVIPQYSAHDIAKSLVYISTISTKSTTNQANECLVNTNLDLVNNIIMEIYRLRSVVKFKDSLLGRPSDNRRLDELLNNYKNMTEALPNISKLSISSQDLYSSKSVLPVSPVSPKTDNESQMTELNGETITTQVKIKFEGASSEDIDRTDVVNFLYEYILDRALTWVNTRYLYDDKTRQAFANYFSFDKVPSKVLGKSEYLIGKTKLERIIIELGKMTVETNATIHFKYVPPEVMKMFKEFVDTILIVGKGYSNKLLAGKLYR